MVVNFMLNFNKVKINKKVILLKPEVPGTTIGAGLIYKGKRFITHNNLPVNKSALETFVNWQKVLLFLSVIALLIGFIISPSFSAIILIAVLTSAYFIDLVFTFYILQRSLHTPHEYTFRKKDFKQIDESELPIYSVLCPFYKEASVLPQFIEAIEKIDWPKDKLDIILLLEEDDRETLDVAQSMSLPSYFRIIVVPDSLPKTKPKACNLGLAYAKGKFLVVYDAEDKPDPMQLKKAYLVFASAEDNVVCLQSKLNYYNSDQNLLTQLFTAEYSLWFDLILPGLQSIEAPIPLGGTSNHFKVDILRELGGWDPFNVTEDCDLGTRIFKAGFKTSIIDSTTYEEANSKPKSWLKQRSRWIKGYIQTYLVHTRNPIVFVSDFGVYAFIFQLIIGMRMIFMVINPILWLMTLSYFILGPIVAPTIESLYPAPVYYIAVFCLVFGNFMYFYNYMLGSAKRNLWHLVKYVFFIPFYWAMASVSASIAIYQLVIKPHYWEKTEHGLHLATVDNEHLDYRKFLPVDILFKFLTYGIFLMGSIKFFLTKNLLEVVELFTSLPSSRKASIGKYNILIFNWRDNKHIWAGGAEVYVHEIAKRLVKQGNSVTLFCGWDGKSKRNGKVNGINVIRRGGFYTMYPIALIYYILKLRGKYDLVIDCENGIPFFTPLYVGIPKILIIHHVHQEVFRKHLKFPLSQIAVFLESKLMPVLYRNCPIITISNSSKEDIIGHGWAKSENIDIVTPAIDLSSYEPKPKTPYPSFVYLGRLMPWKNIDVAITAFAKICNKYPTSKLTIAGFGESFPMLTKLVKKLKIENNVIFSGWVDEATKVMLFAQSWTAIQPSSFEGWGITVIEANACGTPVIASDIKGLRDSVINNRTGILFPVREIETLAEAMDKLIVNESYRAYLSEESYKWARNFTWEYSTYQFEKIINNYLKKIEFLPAYNYLQNRS
ncbi:hypothetical protein A2863_03835 [Candidatus Woesebacteria bacterium RIFCSPHIGHO2_01_FULL_38_9b]|uniref:Glycosyltransferase n=1 Tax=Candidatus Woesebacteria bacterium RIFCSPHIGHO2_01_FULL_38_9b TaxID=1802493 RepID=A0A1F7Y5B9_9BACT|nr:MAG: hypothetical protein A2863_03835 [Candidatus Woesebacteria bacterium RIFCSPHIGHO2_01_FULL_38_9b]